MEKKTADPIEKATDQTLLRFEYEAALRELKQGLEVSGAEAREAVWAFLQILRVAADLGELETLMGNVERQLRERV